MKGFAEKKADMAEDQFEKAKKFSDFVGFHVRALFCLTLMFVALFPSMDSFYLALAYQDPSIYQRSIWEMLFQWGAVCLFAGLMLNLYVNIALTIWNYAGVRWASAAIRRFLFVFVILFAELCGATAIGYMVFLRTNAALAFANGEREKIAVRECLLNEMLVRNGLKSELGASCLETLEQFRATLPE